MQSTVIARLEPRVQRLEQAVVNQQVLQLTPRAQEPASVWYPPQPQTQTGPRTPTPSDSDSNVPPDDDTGFF